MESNKSDFWAPVANERHIPIDCRQHDFDFTRRWFRSRNQVTFSTFLPGKFDGSQPVNLLQIGVFEGMDLVLSFQNILTHPQSRVLAIDPWLSTSRLPEDIMEAVREWAVHNLSPWAEKLWLARGLSVKVLAPLVDGCPLEIHRQSIQVAQWDLVVIDGDHSAPAVLSDARQGSGLLRPGAGYCLTTSAIKSPNEVTSRRR